MKSNKMVEICLARCGTPHARGRAAAAAPLEKEQRPQSRRCSFSTRTSIALRARAGGVPQVRPRSARTTSLAQVKGWLLNMSSESCCYFCIVSAHLIANIGALGSHIPPLMHHTGLARTHVDANAAETTNVCSHARFSCTGTLLQLRGRLIQRIQAHFNANGRHRCVPCRSFVCSVRTGVPHQVGTADFQRTVRALPVSLHGPRHMP